MILGRDICLTEMVGSINIGGGASVIETKQTTLGGVESKPTVRTPAVDRI